VALVPQMNEVRCLGASGRSYESSSVVREIVAEHRKAAKGRRADNLVLKNVPIFGELAVFETYDVHGNP
jgi:hypothetical protein